MAKKSSSTPEIWGGLECSLNRVRSKYFDQLQYCDHYNRIENDIALFSELGITAMRYPVLWERHQPKINAVIDWSKTETSLNALQQTGILPIAGLVHHGSGPKYTDLRDPDFAIKLKSFASSVAEKFPWLEYYTPVNEPLTTARFSGLYGLWYPHKKNDRTFVLTFLHQLKAIVFSMQAIRKINSKAKLVQTEDLAKIYSTPFMKYQADFENHRRWLTFDILCGDLKPGHPLWSYFKKYAPSEKDLYFFIDNPCPPDILGLDYYPTSERYLDENLDKYPPEKHGHNHRHHYADVEAFRVRHKNPCGIGVLLQEVWDRYKIPLAVTEVHINCDVENQIRWFAEIKDTCIGLMKAGVDIKAVTTWAMLGSFGWNMLLTRDGGNYEAGAFDLSSGLPEPTPLADYISRLSKDPDYIHPALNEKGWWHHEERFVFDHYLPAEMVERNNPILKEDCVER